jgi:hypothetical protein
MAIVSADTARRFAWLKCWNQPLDQLIKKLNRFAPQAPRAASSATLLPDAAFALPIAIFGQSNRSSPMLELSNIIAAGVARYEANYAPPLADVAELDRMVPVPKSAGDRTSRTCRSRLSGN